MNKQKQTRKIDVRKLIPIEDVKIFNFNRGYNKGKQETLRQVLEMAKSIKWEVYNMRRLGFITRKNEIDLYKIVKQKLSEVGK